MTRERMCRAARQANCWCARRAPRRGAASSPEYLKDERATAEAWAGGWFHTGDVVREGDDESLFFVDRKKNIVRRSGENIAVVEVEGVLMTLDGVAGVAVAPVPDEIRGEEVFALVSCRATRRSDPRAPLGRTHRARLRRAARLLQGAGIHRFRRYHLR